jgi:uncharacterized membrane protein
MDRGTREEQQAAHRLAAYTDAVFAVIVTVMVLETRRMARRRSLVVLAIFTTAVPVAFVAPRLAFGLICSALILHLRPEVRFTSR